MKDRTDLLGLLPLIFPLVVATTAANAPDSRLNRRHCSTYEHAISSLTTIEGIEFAGVVEHGGSSAPHVGVFDTPLYNDANIAEATLVGRLMGSFWPHVAETEVGDEASKLYTVDCGTSTSLRVAGGSRRAWDSVPITVQSPLPMSL